MSDFSDPNKHAEHLAKLANELARDAQSKAGLLRGKDISDPNEVAKLLDGANVFKVTEEVSSQSDGSSSNDVTSTQAENVDSNTADADNTPNDVADYISDDFEGAPTDMASKPA